MDKTGNYTEMASFMKKETGRNVSCVEEYIGFKGGGRKWDLYTLRKVIGLLEISKKGTDIFARKYKQMHFTLHDTSLASFSIITDTSVVECPLEDGMCVLGYFATCEYCSPRTWRKHVDSQQPYS